MPLPTGGAIPWPPPEVEAINHQYAIWSAWYSGDVDQLAAIYGGGGNGNSGGSDTMGVFASDTGGFKVGVRRAIAAVRRWFWGARSMTTQQRTRLHIPIAGDIAAASADMLFSEPPAFTIPKADQVDQPAKADGPPPPPDPTQARMDELLDDGAHATLLEAAEVCAALGGVFLRIVWDPTVREGRPWLDNVHPDCAVPEWSWGRLVAVTFWREIARKGRIVVRHLERHEPGKIIHGVYAGDADELGQSVALTDYPDTAGLANDQLVDGNTVMTGATGLTAAYVPNMKPNRMWRNNPKAVHLGRSDFAGVEPMMDSLDLVASSLIRDFDLGRARLIVPKEYLDDNGPGKGASLDLDREVYEAINAMSTEDGKVQIEQVQFAIRIDDHQRGMDLLKRDIVGSAGYSASTFGLEEKARLTTATEVSSRDRRSAITRDRKTRYWRPALSDIVEAMLQVDAALFHTGITPVRPDVEFPPAVSVEPLAQAQTLLALDGAGAISTEMKVRTLHPDWDDPEIDDEVTRIHEDSGTGLSPVDAMAGYAGNNPAGGTGPNPPGPNAGGKGTGPTSGG